MTAGVGVAAVPYDVGVDHWTAPSALDRVDEHRCTPDWVAGLWSADDAQLLKVAEEGRFTTDEAGAALRTTKPFVRYDPQRHFLLGLVDGAPIWVVRAVVDGPTHSLRQVGARLNDTERDIAAAAVALTHWHALDPHCPACGARTTVGRGGFNRTCTVCHRESFPRTDAAVIVAIRDAQDRLFLAAQGSWGANRRSVLAGFVEAGESLEQAVHREIAEEADLTLTDVRYFGSQPWPFPRSLMVGFSARAVSADFFVDGKELVAADWYSRAHLTAAVADGSLTLPPDSSIARRLVEAWRADQL